MTTEEKTYAQCFAQSGTCQTKKKKKENKIPAIKSNSQHDELHHLGNVVAQHHDAH